MNYNDETLAKVKTEMAEANITVSLTGEEILSLVAMAQLAYLSNPALGELGECGKSAAPKIQASLNPNSLLSQHLSEGWVSAESRKLEPVNYRDFYPPEGYGSEISIL
jgi:hypothetical protein